MIQIKLIKEYSGKQLTNKFKKKYGSIEKLERMFKRNPEDMMLYGDLDDWIYFNEHHDEKIKETQVLITEKSNIDIIELELMGFIKNEHPKSISELAKIANKDLSSVQKKVNSLKEAGLIELKEGVKNSKIPIVNYDKIEITV